MKVLVACEFSGIVRDAFGLRRHDSWSCDLLPTEKEGQHIEGDAMDAISQGWDLIVMHPPCTALCLSGNSSYGEGMPKNRARVESIAWTKTLWEHAKANSPRVMLENPANVLGAHIGKRTQKIQPYEFGHMEQKETWLWLYGLPKLKPTRNVWREMMESPKRERERLHYMSPGPNRWRERSRTFQGIADAMAEQWGSLPATILQPEYQPQELFT